MNDRKIITLFQQRSEHAVEFLAEAYGKPLYHFALNLLGSARDAQECVNDTYLAVWNAIPPNDPNPLCAYIFRICRNLAAKRLRYENAQKRRGNYDLSLEELAGCIGSEDLLQSISARELGQSIDRFLDTLSKENRILFLRRYWFGDTVRQIAAHTQLTENTVSVRLNRIRGKLKEHLTKEGYFDEA